MSKIKINKYILKNPRIKNNKTILNISDIHSNIKALDKIINFIKETRIDYILLPGDTIDHLNKENEDIFLNKLLELSKYAKTYISLGNHDRYIIKNKKEVATTDKEFINTNYYKKLKESNIFFLNDSFNTIKDKNITISAINFNNDYYASKENKEVFNKYMNNLNKKYKLDNNFNIMLIHSPNNLIIKKKIIDDNLIKNSNLIVCGHNHGGITPTWIQDLFKNHIGLLGPFNSLFQKNAYGIYSNNNTNILISNGVTKISDMVYFKPLHNIVNKILIPEVDLIYLENDNNNSFKLIDRSKYE